MHHGRFFAIFCDFFLRFVSATPHGRVRDSVRRGPVPAAPRGPPPRPAPVQTQPEPVLFEETMVVIKDVGHPGRNEVACATVTPTRLELVKSDGQSPASWCYCVGPLPCAEFENF